MLIGIDPDERKEVPYRGATFTLRVMPKGLFTRLRQGNLVAIEQAKRRVIKRLADDGIDPEGEFYRSEDGSFVLSNLAHHTLNEPGYSEALHAYEVELIRWSLVGHRGFCKADGTEIPFVTEPRRQEGEDWQVPTSSTLRWYGVNKDLLSTLFLQAEALNLLGPTEKKD